MNRRQRRFVDEYLVDLNATQAAIRAGYSERTARAIAAENLTKPDIRTAVDAAMAERAERTKITQDQVIQELAILLKSDVRHFQIDDETGALVLTDGAPDSAWRAVSSVKHRRIVTGRGEDRETTYEVEFRLWDKPAAARLAGQHLGMYVEKHEVSTAPGTGVLAVPVVDAEQWAAIAVKQQAALTAGPSDGTEK